MKNTTLKAHFARDYGLSKPAVHKAIKTGKIQTVEVDGKEVIDLDHRLTKEYMRLHSGKKDKPKKTPQKKSKPEKETDDEESQRLGLQLSLELSDDQLLRFEKVDIDKLDKIESARTRQFNREVSRGNYIDRDLVKSVFAQLYSVDTNELKEMEDRLTPLICGVFKMNDDSPEAVQVRRLLNEEITKSLQHIQRIMDDFLRNGKG
jgi:phage terminase small subunit